jgi:pyruvate formate lyase activating enzyme
MQSLTGMVFDIKKFSIHDGPGIRTTVFLKGCPLHCSWCHNPEGQSRKKEIWFWESRCLNCHDCVQVCEHGALSVVDGRRQYDPNKCQFCGDCTEVCPAEAVELIGQSMQVSEIIDEIKKDIVYYDQSEGGVTFSGGEPFLQIEFLEVLLEACKDYGIHTTVDTSGHTKYENIERTLPLVDLYLYDLKIMDNDKHLQYTGVPNTRILDNLTKLSSSGKEIIPRIPIIPGVNDDLDNIIQSGEFLASLNGIQEINILPYHRTAAHKYSRLGNIYTMSDLLPPSNDYMMEIALEFEKFGFIVRIGG